MVTSGPEGVKLYPLEFLGDARGPPEELHPTSGCHLDEVLCLLPPSAATFGYLWVASSLPPLHSYLMTEPLFIKPLRVLDSAKRLSSCSDDRGKGRILPASNRIQASPVRATLC